MMPKDNQIPEKYRCAITNLVMIDPVFTADGHTYEREAIEGWLQTHDTSPKTNEKLEHKKLTENHDKRSDISEFFDAHPELYNREEFYLPQSWKNQCVIAIKSNRLEEFQKLLNKDKRLLTIELEEGSTVLHLACDFSSPEFVEAILKILSQSNEFLAMMPDTGRFNPIHLNVLLERALNKGSYSNCELLLKLGAEVEQPEATTQNTLLHRMVIQGIQKPVAWLLEQKAVLESRNSEGNTPLLLSVIQGHIKLTKFLLKMNASLPVINAQRKVPFYIAVEKNDIQMAKLLLENGADPTVSCGAAQLTTLHLAAARGDEIMLKYLLDTKAASLINAQDVEGNTALHLTIQAGHDAIIRLLLEAGASHKVKNRENKTPVELANKQQKEKILPLIVQIVRGLEFKVTEEERIREMENLNDSVRSQRQSLKVIQPENKQSIFSKSIQMEKSEQLLSPCFNVNVANVPAVNQKDVAEFLQLIAEGKQVKAKAILKRNPDLVLLAGDVTDSSKCAFMDTPWKSVKTLFIAAHVGHVGAIIAVSKAGIALDTPDNYGFTAVHVAAGNGNVLALDALKSVGANMDMPMPNGATPIYFAAQKGHGEVIHALAAAGANVNMSMPNGETPTHVAAQLGHLTTITALKDAGANVNTPDNYRVTPLHMAAQQGQAEAITVLKAVGANVETPDNLGGTPVFAAAAKGHTAAITALAAAGANMNTPNDVGITPLHIAAQNGHSTTITALKAAGVIMESIVDGFTPLHIAAQEGHVAAIAALKAAGAVVDTSTSILHGFTPLHIAAQNGQVEAIIALKSAGANVNATNQNGGTPICIASQEGRTKAIIALKSVGANVDTPDDDGRTPVYMAAKNGHAGAIIALKANVNMPGKGGATPVYVAAWHGHVSAIKALKAEGATMDIPNNDGFTPIYAAAYQGHTAAINALINAGIDMNKPNSHGFTEVHIAAQNGHAAVITALKAAGANVNISTSDGATPIHIAAYGGHTVAINALIKAGADMNIPDSNGFTEIHLAAQNGHVGAIAALAAAGANVGMPMRNGITPIYMAAQQGHAAAIAALKAAGANVNILMPDGATPAHTAAQNGHAAAITALKAAGAAINKPLKGNGITPIYMAAQQGQVEAIAALKAAGANVNSLNSDGATPVHIAAQKGHAAAISALNAAGADMDMPFEDDGRTAVYMAAQNGHPAVITALKAVGANVDTPAKNGLTPIHSAAKNGHPSAILALKAAGAVIDTFLDNGITPMYLAAENGHSDAITALKTIGASADTRNNDGFTAVFIAAQNGHAEAVSALKAAGANVNTPSKDGSTPVHIAAQNGHASTIAALKAAGADMNMPMRSGAMPIHMAARNGHAGVITALKVAGADVNMRSGDGTTSLCVAAEKGHTAAITALLDAGADASLKTGWGTALEVACKGEKPRHKEVVKLLEAHFRLHPHGSRTRNPITKKEGIKTVNSLASASSPTHSARTSPNAPYAEISTGNGITRMHMAARQGDTAAIVVLATAGENVNMPDNEGATPAWNAAYVGQAKAIVALKAAGANVNTPDNYGYTPIYIAAQNGHAEAITALVAAGANVNEPVEGIMPIHIAAKKGHIEAINALKAAGAAINTPVKDDGRTAVFAAANHGHAKAITALKAAGANVDTPANDGRRPLHIAAQGGHAEVITALKAAGAAMDTLLNDGQTSIYIAAQQGHVAAITALLDAGANASIKTPWGTVLEAVRKGKEPKYKEIVKLLEAHFKQYPNGIKPVGKMNRVDVPAIPKKAKDHTMMDSLEKKNNKELRHSLISDERENAINLPSQAEIQAYAQEKGIPIIMPSGAAPAHGAQKFHKKLEKKPKNEEIYEDKEKLRVVLEKLKTLFLNSKNLNITSENDEMYNKCLKNINNNAQLVYKKAQNKYVLYVNDFALNNEAAVKAIEKMIEALGGISAKPTATIRPSVNTSYQYEDNDIQAILSARLKQLQEQNPKLFIKPIKELGAVDDMTGSELKNRLSEEAKNKSGARICLIPCNLGNAHWIGMLLEFNEEGEVLRAQYIDPFTPHPTVPETFQSQLQKVYPGARLETCALLQQRDNSSCGAYTVENLLIAALGIEPPEDGESIRRMHLECLKEYRPAFYQAFEERQRNNRPTTADIHEQLGYLEGLKSIWFSKSELNRILAIKQCLSNLPLEIQTTLVEVFKHNPAYDDDHALHLKTIRSVLQKTLGVESKVLAELMQLLFELPLESGTPMSLEKLKFRVSYNEILAVSERHLFPQKINDLQKTLTEQIKADEEFAHKLQFELWSSVETPEINQENFKVKFSEIKTQMESQDGIPAAPAPGGPHELMFSHQALPFLPLIRVNAAAAAASVVNPHDKDIEEFLTYIAIDERAKAKAILRRNPALVSLAGDVTDLSEHAFMDMPWKSIKTLFIAAERGHVGAISALNKSGVPVEIRNNVGITPLYIAAKKGQVAAINALVTVGANVNTPRDDGATPIFVAAQNGHTEAVTVLKAAGSNVNTPRNDGATPILVAAQNGHVSTIVALLGAGADASIKTKWGTALEMAKKGKKPEHLKVVSLLETHFKQYPNGINQAMGKQVSNEPQLSDIKTRLEPLVLHTISAAEANSKEIEEFLEYIATGEQAKAKAMLKRNPELEKQMRAHAKDEATRLKRDSALLSLMGEVADLPKHTFMETPWKSLKTLFIAVEKGHMGAINALIRAGVPVNKPNSVGVTPVFIAAENGHAEAITALKAAGADVNRLDKLGRPAMNAAARNGHTEAIMALKAAGADVNRSFHGYTPVSGAAENGHIAAIAALKAAGANMDTPDDRGITPVSLAAQNGHADAITALKKAGANVDNPDKEGWTPVSVAAEKGYTDVISALIKAGAKLNTPMPNGATPVYIAAEKGHAEVITLLNAAGANVSTPTKGGYRPIGIAAEKGHAEAITALKAAGADMDIPDRRGFTPVFVAAERGQTASIYALKAAGTAMNRPCKGITPVWIAASHGHADVIQALKSSGASMETPYDGCTPVFIAAQNGHAVAITALKAGGADVNLPCKGVTPIWTAAENGYAEAIIALKLAGADVNVLCNGETAVYIAARFGHTKAITALKAAGANVNAQNDDGVTPICAATIGHHPEAVKALKAAGADMVLSSKLVTRMEAMASKVCGVPINLSAQEQNVSMLFQSNRSDKSTKNSESKGFMKVQEALTDARQKTASVSASLSPEASTLANFNAAVAMPNRNPKDIQEFLTLVAEGEQGKAEAMLRINPALVFVSGDVTDLSKRTFTNITGFQYAVWALDWHMWTMIRKYLSDDEAKKQAQGFETGTWVKSHGVHAQRLLDNLIKVYQTTVDLYHAGKHDEGNKVWVQQVGGAQRLLPAHIVNEYCHPTRRFFPVPNFKDISELPRSRMFDEGEWFTALYKGGKLGDKFAVCRGGDAMTMAESRVMASGMDAVLNMDKTCLRALSTTRKTQREELVNELCVRRTQKFVA